ncbi:MAG: hypothetical protein KC931_19375, partial [Candidatus Omnitrophica bacterium]|nr:hypothetical protein [Candidatus Omnitrophota bacterium]
PNFNSDSGWFSDRLSEEKRATNNPFRMLIDRVGFVPGKDLVFGSDGMPHGVEYAVQQSLFPEFPGQTLSLDEFVAGYCVADMRHGQIDLQIDEKNRTVSVAVDAVLPPKNQ